MFFSVGGVTAIGLPLLGPRQEPRNLYRPVGHCRRRLSPPDSCALANEVLIRKVTRSNMHATCRRPRDFLSKSQAMKTRKKLPAPLFASFNLEFYSFSGNVCGALNPKVTEIDLQACCGNLRVRCGPAVFRHFPEILKSILSLNFQAGSFLA